MKTSKVQYRFRLMSLLFLPLLALASSCGSQTEKEPVVIERGFADLPESQVVHLSREDSIKWGLIPEHLLNPEMSGEEALASYQRNLKEAVASMENTLAAYRLHLAFLRAEIDSAAAQANEVEKFIDEMEKEYRAAIEKLNEDAIAATVPPVPMAEAANPAAQSAESGPKDGLYGIIEQQRAEVEANTAWFIVGTERTLARAGITESAKLALGAPRRLPVLKAEFDKTEMTMIRKDKRLYVPVFAAQATVLTSHPGDAYTWDCNEDGSIRYLVVKNPGRFWKESDCLVIVKK